MTLIIFSLSTRLKLRERATARLATESNAMKAIMYDIEAALQRAFPDHEVLIVQDLHESYQHRDGEYVLQVELQDAQNNSVARIVKLGPEERLTAELDNWQKCRQEGLRHDLVLTVLEPRYAESAPGDSPVGKARAAARKIARGSQRKKLVALVYDDAQQFIGLNQTPSLEASLLESVRSGFPTPASVADVLFSMYERLDLLLYRNSCVEDPASADYEFSLGRFDAKPPEDEGDSKLGENLRRWQARESAAFKLRGDAMTLSQAAGLGESYRDPVDFLLYLQEQCPANRAAASHLIPRMLRGSAHGDLHGRNVLVGRVDQRVLWPAVFDYGDMGQHNVVGWDFVKMETEFKIRAYTIVFPQHLRWDQFVPEVVRFETALHVATEAHLNSQRWPDAPGEDLPLDRLKWLLLKLRQQAAIHLGQSRRDPGRPREWLAEYYFLLTVYGLNSVRFANLSALEQSASYLSSGAACARYLYDRKPPQITNRAGGSPSKARPISHHGQLAEIRRNWRDAPPEDRTEQLKQAERDLILLREQFSHVLEIQHELAVVLEKQGKLPEARELAAQLQRSFNVLDDETLCRFGKLHKRAAIDAERAGSSGAAQGEFEQAEASYGKAFELSGAFYPRINQLSLRFARAGSLVQSSNPADVGRRDEGRALVEIVRQEAIEMLNDPTVWYTKTEDDATIWAPASQAEAHFLAQQWTQSADAYQAVLSRLANRTAYVDIIRPQLELLVRSAKRAGLTIEGHLANLDTFFTPDQSP